jgi:hypothetical protein
MRKAVIVLAASAAASFLAACTPTTPPGPTPPALAASPSPSPAPSSTPTPSDTAIPAAATPTPSPATTLRPEDIPCQELDEVSDHVLEVVGHNPDGSAIVAVGEGNRAGELWWVVAVDGANDSAAHDPRVVLTWLTNEPSPQLSSGVTWIQLGVDTMGRDHGFDDVNWEPDKLARLAVAVDAAVGCLA